MSVHGFHQFTLLWPFEPGANPSLILFFGGPMYQWQILTLARVERIVKPEWCNISSLMARVKETVYHLGEKHFLTPQVFVYPPDDPKGFHLVLRWEVEDRIMEIRFREGPNIEVVGWLNGGLSHMSSGRCFCKEWLKERADWLILGTEIKELVAR